MELKKVEDCLPPVGKKVLTYNSLGGYSVDRLLDENLWESVNNFHSLMMDYTLTEQETLKVIAWCELPVLSVED